MLKTNRREIIRGKGRQRSLKKSKRKTQMLRKKIRLQEIDDNVKNISRPERHKTELEKAKTLVFAEGGDRRKKETVNMGCKNYREHKDCR